MYHATSRDRQKDNASPPSREDGTGTITTYASRGKTGRGAGHVMHGREDSEGMESILMHQHSGDGHSQDFRYAASESFGVENCSKTSTCQGVVMHMVSAKLASPYR